MNDERDLIEIQICMTRLMRQKLLRDELRHQLEDYEFEGRIQEQRAVCSAIISLARKSTQILYQKMADFTEVKHKKRAQKQITEVWWKDCVQE